MNCKKCGAVLGEADTFCLKCGAKVEHEVFCSRCGKKLYEGASYCSVCGTKYGNTIEKGKHYMPSVEHISISKAISDKWAWALATVPTGIMIVMPLITSSRGIMWALAITASIVFFFLDKAEIEKSGIGSYVWIWVGLVIVPIYLWIRVYMLKTSNGYALVWLAMLIPLYLMFTATMY